MMDLDLVDTEDLIEQLLKRGEYGCCVVVQYPHTDKPDIDMKIRFKIPEELMERREGNDMVAFADFADSVSRMVRVAYED